MEFSRPEYWSVLPFPSPGDLPNPGIEPRSPTLQADSLPAEPPGKPFVNHTYQSKFKLSQALIWLGGLMLKFIHFFFSFFILTISISCHMGHTSLLSFINFSETISICFSANPPGLPVSQIKCLNNTFSIMWKNTQTQQHQSGHRA